MTPKKFTRGVFYVLGGAVCGLFVYMIVETIISNWRTAWPPVVAVLSVGGAIGIGFIVQWAFSPEKVKPKQAPKTTIHEPKRQLGYEHIETIKYHFPTEESAGDGIQGMCFCGEPIDDYFEHVIEMYEETK